MSRKHFIKLAAAIAAIQDEQVRAAAAKAVAEVCNECNERFNLARFMTACNVKE